MKTLHLISLPHTQVSKKFCGCAYTAKVLKFCKMMKDTYNIKLYAPEGPKIEGAELIPCLSNVDRITTFGVDDPTRLPAWPTDEQTRQFNANVIMQIRENTVDEHELILLSGGWTHKSISDALPNRLICEPFCGYEGIFTDKVAFESYSHRHTVYAKRNLDGRWFDTVIPNFFDLDEFPQPAKETIEGKYLLFVGRLIARKGVHIASEIARATGFPLYVAGAGGKQLGTDIVADELTIKDAKYLGPVDIAQRAELMRNAHAVLVPTTYIEPFGGVAVEAMMAGTPAITPNFGAFTETVLNGVSGFRFTTLKEAIRAVEMCGELKPKYIRDYAVGNFGLANVRGKFQSWFNKLDTLWDKGWYQL
jgi:glycosyltransferase involved in cell wall biosynthesis